MTSDQLLHRACSVDVFITPDDLRRALQGDVRAGLSRPQKSLSPVWFYDDRGSFLFDVITRLDEYYLARAETRLLESHAHEIAEISGASTLVELGSGTSEKSRVLLDAFAKTGSLRRYAPLDVSEGTLRLAAAALAEQYPSLSIAGCVGDYSRHLGDLVCAGMDEGSTLVAFLGSTIGNLKQRERARFLFDVDCAMGKDDYLLLGADVVKDLERLFAAYDDPKDVTAEFNRNVLCVLNRELNANFRPELFEHVVCWDNSESCIEMRLRSVTDQIVDIGDLDMRVQFRAGEELLTETSAKFTPESLTAELYQAGLVTESSWEDEEGFLLVLARPYC